MADLSDVEQALVALIGSIVYPGGYAVTPSGPPPGILGSTLVDIYSGWPVTSDLDADIKAGRCNVSVFSMPQGSRNTSRYSRDWQPFPTPGCTLTATASGNAVTFGGIASAEQLAAFSAGRIGWVYAVQAGDTLSTIAAALAALVTSDGRLIATASGATVTVTDPTGLALPASCTTAALGSAWRETRRQEQRLMVTAWCPTPLLRDQLAAAIDNALSGIDWLAVGSDPTLTRIRYFSTSESDAGTDASAYRRDLHFLLEYPTIQTQTSAPLIYATALLHALGVDITAGTQSPISGVLSTDGGTTIETDAAGDILVQPTP